MYIITKILTKIKHPSFLQCTDADIITGWTYYSLAIVYVYEKYKGEPI